MKLTQDGTKNFGSGLISIWRSLTVTDDTDQPVAKFRSADGGNYSLAVVDPDAVGMISAAIKGDDARRLAELVNALGPSQGVATNTANGIESRPLHGLTEGEIITGTITFCGPMYTAVQVDGESILIKPNSSHAVGATPNIRVEQAPFGGYVRAVEV